VARLRFAPLRVGDAVAPEDVVLCGSGDQVLLAFSRRLMSDYLGIDARYLLPELFEEHNEREVYLTVPEESLFRLSIPPGIGSGRPHPTARVRDLDGSPRYTSDLGTIDALFDERQVFARSDREGVEEAPPPEREPQAPGDSGAPPIPRDRRIGISGFPRMGPRTGVVIERTLTGGPAAEAGLVTGDKIVAVNGQPVGDIWDLKRELRASRGPTVVLSVRHRGETITELVEIELD
jgi:hypothetical protein